jgi:microsomal dipeptidase-like Zn-dependent dipeptidase
MLHKRDLFIDTDFFDPGVEGIPDAIMVPQFEHDYIKDGLNEEEPTETAARNIERLLTNKLI